MVRRRRTVVDQPHQCRTGRGWIRQHGARLETSAERHLARGQSVTLLSRGHHFSRLLTPTHTLSLSLSEISICPRRRGGDLHQILDALACVLHGLLPLLIHLRFLPPRLSGSFLLTDSEDQSPHDPATGHSPIRKSPPPSSSTSSSSAAAALPSLQYPTSHLLSSFHLAILSPSITLLQILQLVLARSPSTHKWFGGFWCTLVLLVAIVLPLDAIAVIRERSTREAERLLEIGQTFAAAGDQGGGRGGGKEVGPGDGDEDEIEDQWICSICLLRGSDDSPEEDAPLGQDDDDNARSSDPDNPEKQTITFDTRCHLPCAHSCTCSLIVLPPFPCDP